MKIFNIVLDPGHGQYGNPGYIDGFYEGTNNFEGCQMLKEYLEKYQNVKVTITRDKITDNPSTYERGVMGQKANLFISWHSNGFSNESAKGISTFYSQYINDDKTLCDTIGASLVSIFGSPTYYRGASKPSYDDGSNKNRDYYGVIRNSVLTNGNNLRQTPVRSECKHSIIIEHGFHSNERECLILMDFEKFKKIIEIEAATIAEYFNLKPIETNKGYTVQVGYFNNKKYAEDYCEKLKADGYPAFVKNVNY